MQNRHNGPEPRQPGETTMKESVAGKIEEVTERVANAARTVELASRIDACLDRLTEGQIWSRGKENENAVGNLVLHLCGNVKDRKSVV